MTRKDTITVALIAALCIGVGVSFGASYSFAVALHATCYAALAACLGFLFGASLQGQLVAAQREWIDDVRRLLGELRAIAESKRNEDRMAKRDPRHP